MMAAQRQLSLRLSVVLGALALLLIFPAAGRAGCGGVESAPAASHPSGQAPPLAIGDSTMLLSLPGLSREGYDANAHGCREFSEALAMLRQMRAAGTLPHMVVIALGANGTVSGGDINDTLRLLCCNRLLVLVTPRELGGGSGSDAATDRQAASEHPGRILLLDWVKYSQGHGSWFQPDGLHLTLAGVSALNTLLARALPYAYVPCPPGTLSRARATARRRARSIVKADNVPGLTIATSASQLGYIDVSISGPPGVSVALSEQRSGRSIPVRDAQLPVSGTLNLPRALTWLCAPRTRTLTVTTLAPVPAPSVSSTIQTPSCAKRLVFKIGARARVGGSLTVTVRDRWGIGGAPIITCVTAPGAGPACSASTLPSGSPRHLLRIPTPRPGGWQVTIKTDYGQQTSRTVWASHPAGRIRLLAAGDSEMQILDDLLGQDLGSHRVSVISDARISTGLTNSFFFNWQTEARRLAQSLQPDVTVIFIGANDGFAVPGPGGKPVACCGSAWSAGYANLAAEMMSTLLRGNSGRVYWFLLPTPRPGNFQYVFDGVNRGISEAARRFPGRVALIDANAFFTPGNRYRDYMVYHGQGFTIHEGDGIHLSTASDQIAATLVVRRLLADRIIR